MRTDALTLNPEGAQDRTSLMRSGVSSPSGRSIPSTRWRKSSSIGAWLIVGSGWKAPSVVNPPSVAMTLTGRSAEAIVSLREFRRQRPDFEPAQRRLEKFLALQGESPGR